jgi:hypothetical protein
MSAHPSDPRGRPANPARSSDPRPKTPPEVPQPPRCFKEGCGDWGSWGFLFPGKRQEWACFRHKDEMAAAWDAAVKAKVDADAEALKPKQGSLW